MEKGRLRNVFFLDYGFTPTYKVKLSHGPLSLIFTDFSRCLILNTCHLVSNACCLRSNTLCPHSRGSGCSHQGGHTQGGSSCSRDLLRPLAWAAAVAVTGIPGLCLSPEGRGMTLGGRQVKHQAKGLSYTWGCIGHGTGHLAVVHLLTANCMHARTKSQLCVDPKDMARIGQGMSSWGLKDHPLLPLSQV